MFGDLHGRLDLLEDAMAAVQFNAENGDWLVGLGDWLDRGPDTLEIGEFIENQKNLVFVRGNHEQLLWGVTHPTFFGGAQILPNGGKWTLDHFDAAREHPDPERAYLDEAGTNLQYIVNNAPLALTIRTPKGKRVGIVHADVPGTDWNEFTAYLDEAKRSDMGGEETAQNTAMWGRKTLTRLERADSLDALDDFDCTITGIDHDFTGHTIVHQPIKRCNRSWIDTGAYETDELTFVEIDDWINQ